MVSGGASKSRRSTSTTSAMLSTSRLTASPWSRTTMTTGSSPAGRAGRPSRSRSSMAGTTWPRRLIRPATAGGASGTRVMLWLRSTSCTCSTSTPNRSPSSQKVASWLVAGMLRASVAVLTSDLQEGGGGVGREGGRAVEAEGAAVEVHAGGEAGVRGVERRVGGEDGGADVEQLGDPVTDDRGAEQAQVVDVALHRGLAVDDVEDLLDDDRDAAAVVGVDDDLEHLAVGVAEGTQVPVQADDRQDRAAVLHHLAGADPLDGLAAHLLEPGDRVQRDGDPAPAADGGQQHPLTLAGRGGGDRTDPALLPLGGLGTQRAAGQRLDVEDQRDRAVTEHGGSGVEPDRLELAAHGLDHDLLGVDDPVHDQAEPASLGAEHGDDHVAVVPVGGQAEHVREAHQREQLTAQPVDRRAADVLDRRGGLLGVQGDELLQADLRDRVPVTRAL